MHFYFLTLTLLLPTLVSAAPTSASDLAKRQNFVGSCTDYALRDDHILSANCQRGDGSVNYTEEDLNYCIANRSPGQLVWAANGAYAYSCQQCYLQGTYMLCTCNDGGGGFQRPSIDLNERVANQGGNLACTV